MYSKEKPLYPFGYGLSYTTFAYESLSLSAPSVNHDGKVEVTVKVKNAGARASDEVVQMYVQHLGSAVERPQLELKGFERVHIEPGAEKNVVIELTPRDLAYWDTAAHASKRSRYAYSPEDRVPSCPFRRFFRSRQLASTNRSAMRSGSEHSLAPWCKGYTC